jgi:Ca-activated chloride channel homolog
MRWGEQEILFWLLALIPLALLSSLLRHLRSKRLEKLADRSTWNRLIPGYSPKRHKTKNMLRLLSIGLIIMALARPQWGTRWEEVKMRGLDIVVALDTSRSMLAQDIKPNRLQQAKWGIRDLVKQLKGDRIGLIAFAGEAFLQCPATIDYAAFLMMLDDTYSGIIPLGGTDLYEALNESINSFDSNSTADKVIILISDGEGHTGDPRDLLPKLKKDNIRIFAIGVGTREGDLIQTSEGFVKDKAGHVVKSALNENMLQLIARETGGFYIRSAPGDFGLERVYEQGIAQLQREERESRLNEVWQERFVWFLGGALLLLLIEAAIQPVKQTGKKLKKSAHQRAVRSLALVAISLLTLQATNAQGEGTPRSDMRRGLQEYKQGNYTNAVELLKKTVLEFPDIGHYNLGNALYRIENYEEAEKAFEEALRSEQVDLQANAYFNRGCSMLARTTSLTSTDQIGLAAELCFQAQTMFEKSLLLRPDDLEAKRNFERAHQLRNELEFNQGRWLYDQAEELLKAFNAKEAKPKYEQAKKQFEHILENVDPDHKKAQQFLPNVIDRLDMLKRAVDEAEKDLRAADVFITSYQYMLAAQRLVKESDERKYAFSLKPDLQKKYEETLQKTSEVLDILNKLDTNLNL